MTYPKIESGKGKKLPKISLEAGDEWISPTGESREIFHSEGTKVYTKIRKEGKVVERKYMDRGSIHNWIKKKHAIKYTL